MYRERIHWCRPRAHRLRLPSGSLSNSRGQFAPFKTPRGELCANRGGIILSRESLQKKMRACACWTRISRLGNYKCGVLCAPRRLSLFEPQLLRNPLCVCLYFLCKDVCAPRSLLRDAPPTWSASKSRAHTLAFAKLFLSQQRILKWDLLFLKSNNFKCMSFTENDFALHSWS